MCSGIPLLEGLTMWAKVKSLGQLASYYSTRAEIRIIGVGYSLEVLSHRLEAFKRQKIWGELGKHEFVFDARCSKFHTHQVCWLVPSQLHAFQNYVDWLAEKLLAEKIQGVSGTQGKVYFERELTLRGLKEYGINR